MTTRKKGVRGPLLLGIFLLGVLLFNFPLLALFNVNTRLWGVPVLYVYLFASWGALIALMYYVIERNQKG